MDLSDMGRQAKAAFQTTSRSDSATRQAAVHAIADELEHSLVEIREANQIDIDAGRQAGLTEALIDRLSLTDARLGALIADVQTLADLPDPIGQTIEERTLPNGLHLSRRRVPLGVMGVIYESRPNVTIDVASLAIKTGNTAILRGGKETLHSNRILVDVVGKALRTTGLPGTSIQFIDDPDRALVKKLLRLNDYIDVIIPRGGNGLHNFCRENANIPVITGGIGICHIFVDSSADLTAALPLIHNAKTQRPSVCNSLDTLLVHEEIARDFLPQVVRELARAGVTFRADPASSALVNDPSVLLAGAEDYDTEWLSLILGLRVVPDLQAAIDHIQAHSTHHSDGILTGDRKSAEKFIEAIDSAAVFVNASTRFNDGTQFGLGAEVAVSTQRLHARGPMGLPELTTYKWIVEGDYAIRS
jgi:glutamate-5-semialdehyde dehydrogenase